MASEPRSLTALGLVPLVLILVAGAPRGLSAQDRVVVEPSTAPPGHLQIIVDPPITRAPISEQHAYRRAELSWLAFRSRNILIGSSVATAVGAALVFPAEANQCPGDEMSLNRCTPGGKAMVVIGYPLLLIGGISTLASGIAFGIMKGKLRRFEQRAGRRESRALRWDLAGSRFAF